MSTEVPKPLLFIHSTAKSVVANPYEPKLGAIMSKNLRIAFLGDLNGGAARAVLRQQLPALRERFNPDLILANGENIRNGSGISAELFAAICGDGINGVTLGDHVFRDRSIVPALEDPSAPICRPANLSSHAPGKRVVRLQVEREPGEPSVGVWFFSVLGRVGVGLPANDPFEVADEVLASLPVPPGQRPIVFVDAHMEATAEKAALAHYLDGRVAAVLGTHTHIPTADARLLPGGTAFQTDVGMCGPYDSIIGRDPGPVLRHMRTGVHTPYEMGSGGERISGAVVEVDVSNGRAVSITSVIEPPFTSG